jgi:glycosyltransferase involved in cell wall biosynthesis
MNEAASIGSLVRQVRQILPTVLVIDDGCADETASEARRAGAEVIQHPMNLGKGAALATGLRHAHRRGFSWALLMDGDGQHSPQDLPAFFHTADATNAALVIGNRLGSPGEMPWLRRVVNRWMSRRLSRRAGVALPDSQCGLRLIELRAWAGLSLTTTRFEIESEMLLAFLAAGNGVEFVPIRTIYKSETSKIHPLFDTVRWFRWWWNWGPSRVPSARADEFTANSWASLPRLKHEARAKVE